MNQDLEQLKHAIAEIQARNTRVELDKAWETSTIRKLIITGLTYFVMTLFMYSLGNDKPYLNAIIPTLGFVLSTLSMPVIKKWWVNKLGKKNEFHSNI